jgi:phosphoribosyl-AMP cyclohydrolase
MNAVDKIQFNEKGLVPVITQDFVTSEVLMMAWMNKEALSFTTLDLGKSYGSKGKSLDILNKSLRFIPTATRTLLCSK